MYFKTTSELFKEPSEEIKFICNPHSFLSKNIFLAMRGLASQIFSISARIGDLIQRPNTTQVLMKWNCQNPDTLHLETKPSSYVCKSDTSELQIRFSTQFNVHTTENKQNTKILLFAMSLRMFQKLLL